MATDDKEHLATAVEALQTQLNFLKEDLTRGDQERVVFALRSLRFLASRVEELITQTRVPDASRIAHGPPITRTRVDGDAVRAAIIEVLSESPEPVAVKDLMEALIERGVGVPGQGRPANVVAYLTRMKDSVERVDYGRYTLRKGAKRLRSR